MMHRCGGCTMRSVVPTRNAGSKSAPMRAQSKVVPEIRENPSPSSGLRREGHGVPTSGESDVTAGRDRRFAPPRATLTRGEEAWLQT